VTIGANVTSIGSDAFYACYTLTNVFIPRSVTDIGGGAFGICSSLTSAYFQGNAPPDNGAAFYSDNGITTVYYLSGTLGWGSTFGGVPTALSQPQFSYNIIGNAITITGYTGSSGNVVIPDTINGLPVTSFGNNIFPFSTVTSVTIGNNITSIGQSAFDDCTYLTNAIIGTNVTSIAYEAFFFCYNLTNVTIPYSVTNIGDYAFGYCSSLTSAYFQGNAPPDDGTVFFHDSTTVYYLRGTTGWGSTFGSVSTAVSQPQFYYAPNNGAITITGYAGSGGKVVIPDAINGLPVTSIGGFAFDGYNSLTSVIIGNNVTSIGDGAFEGCFYMTNVIIPANVTSIGDYGFGYCYRLTSADFQGNAPPDDGMAFYADSGITTVYYLYDTTGWGSTFGGVPAALALPQFSYTVNNGVITITGYAGGAAIIPDTVNGLPVTSIGYGAFFFNTSLTSLTVGANVTSIGDYAFDGCSSLTSVYFQGNAPPDDGRAFINDNAAILTLYYLPGTTGWGSTFSGIPTALLNSTVPSLSIALTRSLGLTTNASGIFSSPIYYPVGNAPNCVTAFTNVDGYVDLACVSAGGYSLTLLTNNGSGIFTSNTTFNVGSESYAVTAADVNGDGKMDLIYANINNPSPGSGNNGTVTVLTNNGSGGFGSNATYNVGSYPVSLITADVNNDGKPDLICANYGNYEQGSISVLTNDGSGGFATAATINVGSAGGFGPNSVTAADVNKDGWVDLICVNTGASGSGNTLLVFTNDHSGGFELSSSPVVGYGPLSVTAADVNNDGWVDLICANTAAGTGTTLSVLTNDHSGGFELSSSPVVGAYPYSVVAADVNGDGWTDLICAVGGYGLSVLTNNESGGFVLATNISLTSEEGFVGAADVNGDGAVDLISTIGGVNNSVAVLTNTPVMLTNTINSVVVTWPFPSTGYVLEQNNNLATTNWTNSSLFISDNGTIKSATNSPATGNLFFRLLHR
jgi:hypothetical protein